MHFKGKRSNFRGGADVNSARSGTNQSSSMLKDGTAVHLWDAHYRSRDFGSCAAKRRSYYIVLRHSIGNEPGSARQPFAASLLPFGT